MSDPIAWRTMIEHHNGHRIGLNPVLLEKQGITRERYDQIVQTERVRLDLMDAMKDCSPKDRRRLRIYAELFSNLEYIQQLLWGFTRDSNFHRFWRVPHCTCPKTENEVLWGSVVHLVEATCPVHGLEDQDGQAPR